MAAASAEANWQRIAIGAGAAMFLGMALGRFSYSAMIPALVDAGHLSTVSAGYIGGANLAGFLIGAALSTTAAWRLGTRAILNLSIVLAIVALAASALPWESWGEPGAIWLGAMRALAGVSTGCIMVLGLAITAQAAPPERRTQAMSYIFVGVGGGILFGGTVVPRALETSILAAWLTVAAAGLVAGALALWAWRILPARPSRSPQATTTAQPERTSAQRWQWYAVIAASSLFSIGIVPHTIYWFDYLARDLALGVSTAGWHWTGVGVFAIVGPLLASRLAASAGTAVATLIIYAVMAIGVALPFASQATVILIASTVIFGAQPAVSTLLGARARDLGGVSDMPAMMRAIILANSIGSAMAGIGVPMLLGLTGSYELLFLIGGLALALGGILCLPAVMIKADH